MISGRNLTFIVQVRPHSNGGSTLGRRWSLNHLGGGLPLRSYPWHSSGSSELQFHQCLCLLKPEAALGDGLASCSLLWLQLWRGIWSPRWYDNYAALPGPPGTDYRLSDSDHGRRTGWSPSVKELSGFLLWRPYGKEACSLSFWTESQLKETTQNDLSTMRNFRKAWLLF